MTWPRGRSPISRRSRALGGMAAAIEKGMPKLRIEEAAARTQARIDSGEQALVGVNAYQPENDIEVDVLKIDNAEVRARQLAKLQQLKGTRDVAAVESALDALAEGRARRRQSARIRDPRRARQRHGRRDLAGAGKGVRPPRRRRPDDLRRLSQGDRRQPGGRPRAGQGRGLREEGTGASRASWSPRWDRTATTAARRSSPPPSPISAST